MIGRPQSSEAAPYYSKYIDRISSEDIVGVLGTQVDEAVAFFRGISQEESLHRYEPGKWSIREVLSHVNDVERVFLYRALWFARGFDTPLPSFDQNIGTSGARADAFSWTSHVDEFRAIRLATVAFFRNLPAEAWSRGGIASGNAVTVRALAYILAGHVDHHIAIVRERYFAARAQA